MADQSSVQATPASVGTAVTATTGGPSTLSFEQVLDRDIFDLLGLHTLPEKERNALRAVMEETVKNRIIARIVDQFSAAELETWNNLADAGAAKQLAFLDQHKAVLERLALEEALVYKYEVAQLIDVVRTGAQSQAAT